MSKLAKALTAAAGNAGGESLYVEDVFSTYLYTGTGSSLPIVNGIDLADAGGLVWTKRRTSANSNWFLDSERGGNQIIRSNTTEGQFTSAGLEITSFNSDGYTLGTAADINSATQDDVSWTFRKAEKFFDVVTYTGDGTNGREIPHSLAGDVGMVIVKCTSDADQWLVWHKSTPTGYLRLDGTGTLVTSFAQFKFGNGTTTVNPTSSVFTVAGDSDINGSGRTYVAYLFASDAGGFGDDGDESIIKCGSYTGNGSADGPDINLGFEAQWVMIKRTDASGNDWVMMDIMRGMPADSGGAYLRANLSSNEAATAYMQPTPTGLKVRGTGSTQANASGATYIYIAIRRPMKTPESGTEVFAIDNGNGTSGYDSGFPVDMGWRFSDIAAGSGFQIASRLNAKKNLYAYSSNAENNAGGFTFDSNIGWGTSVGINTNDYSWMFKRATGFFDVVAYTGDGVAGSTQAHNLGVVPECMIVKRRDGASSWITYWDALGATKGQFLDTNQAFTSSSYWNDTAPTATQLTLGSGSTNNSGATFIAYLFATLDGVSKVGSYTGTGADLNVDCGFSAGARFILIKRTDSTGDWYVWDSVRGIVAGNDPYLLLNSTAAEVTSTDYIDPLSSGFTVTSSAPAALNASGGTYIFLAIA